MRGSRLAIDMTGLMDAHLAGDKKELDTRHVCRLIYAVGGASAGKGHSSNRPFLSVEFQMDPSYKDVFVRCVSNQ